MENFSFAINCSSNLVGRILEKRFACRLSAKEKARIKERGRYFIRKPCQLYERVAHAEAVPAGVWDRLGLQAKNSEFFGPVRAQHEDALDVAGAARAGNEGNHAGEIRLVLAL